MTPSTLQAAPIAAPTGPHHDNVLTEELDWHIIRRTALPCLPALSHTPSRPAHCLSPPPAGCLCASSLEVDMTVPEIPWMVPGEAAAAAALADYFSRIGCYSADRNDPSLPGERRTGVCDAIISTRYLCSQTMQLATQRVPPCACTIAMLCLSGGCHACSLPSRPLYSLSSKTPRSALESLLVVPAPLLCFAYLEGATPVSCGKGFLGTLVLHRCSTPSHVASTTS